MASRLELQIKLEEILGSKEVYFDPPESVKMTYPAIVYTRSNIRTQFANNSPYKHNIAYDVTVIDPDPDGEIALRMAENSLCRHDRHFVVDNLHHDTYTLYW